MLGKDYLFPTFPSNCCFICLFGSYFCSLNALFGSPVWGNVCRAAILFVYTWRSVSRTLQKFPRFSNFNLLIQKNSKFWPVCTVFDRKRKNTENGKSTKRDFNFVKRRNGGLNLIIFQPMTNCYSKRIGQFWSMLKTKVLTIRTEHPRPSEIGNIL